MDDPTKILVENYTPEQSAAQKKIDEIDWRSDAIKGELLVIVPFRDRWDLTGPCLESLFRQKLPPKVKLRIALVDNGSVSQETKDGIALVLGNSSTADCRILRANYDFNYSRLNNDAFREFSHSDTSWVLFLNNDVEFKQSNVIEKMLVCLESSEKIGVVGATLLYPQGHIQHLFAAPGVKIIAAHPLKGAQYNQLNQWFLKPARPVGAVTGALMMMRASDFKDAGLFDEDLPTTGQDIDLCLAMYYKLGKIVSTVTIAEVVHKETATRKAVSSHIEVVRVVSKWNDRLGRHPFYSSRLSRFSEYPLLEILPGLKYPMSRVVSK